MTQNTKKNEIPIFNHWRIPRALANRGDIHITRKLWHMGTGLIALFLYFVLDLKVQSWIRIATTVALTGLIVDFIRLRVDVVNEHILKVGGIFYRENERNNYSGLPFYALGMGITLFLFPEKIAILSVLFLVFADPIASYFGVKYGKDKLMPNKSLQGTVAAFAVCMTVSIIYAGLMSGFTIPLFAFALLAGLVGAISELLSVFIDDNLTIPVFSGLGLYVLNIYFHLL